MTFAPGETRKTQSFSVIGDAVVESDETFFVDLSSPVGSTIAKGRGVATVVNDDARRDTTPDAFSFTAVTDAEPGSVQTSNAITVSGINAASPISVTGGSYSINDGTFVTTAGTVMAGQTVRMRQTASSTASATTTAMLNIGGVSAGYAVTTTGPTVSINDASLSEGNRGTSIIRLTFRLSAPSTRTVSVRFATANGTAMAGSDYVARTGTTTFAPGETSKTQPYTINGDTTSESDETFLVDLNTPVGTIIAKARGVITIVNDDVATDTTPEAFSFTRVTDAAAGSLQTSNTITVSGINAATPISVTGGSYSIGGGAFVTTAGMVTAGQTVSVRQTASSAANETTAAKLSIGGVSADYVVTTAGPTVSINDASLSEGNSGQQQVTLTVGLSVASGTSVTVAYATAGGTATSGSDYTAQSGTLTLGAGVTSQTVSIGILGDTIFEPDETVLVDLTSAINATIAKGQGVIMIANDDVDVDTTPDAFSFAPVTDAALGSVQTSDAITVSGIDAATPISVTDGSYSIDGGAFVTTAGTVTAGQTVSVQQTASSTANATTAATLSIGGISAEYTVTTAAPAVSIDDITIAEGDDGQHQATLTVSLSAPSATAVTVAFMTSDGTATAGSDYRSQTGTLGFGAGVQRLTVSIETFGDTLFEPDETVQVDLSHATNATTADGQGVITIVNDDIEGDTTPDAFSFAPVPDAVLGSEQTSDSVTISGISAASPITVSGGSYSINGGSYLNDPGVVRAGDRVRLKTTAAETPASDVMVSVRVGDIESTWRVTTEPRDDTADVIRFKPDRNVGPGTLQTSNEVVLSGFNVPLLVSVIGGQYSLDGGAWTSDSQTVTRGTAVRVRQTASGAFGRRSDARLKVGAQEATYQVNTVAIDKTQDQLIFHSVAGVAPGATMVSAPLVVTDIRSRTPISVAGVGARYSIDGGAFTAEDGWLNPSSEVRLQMTLNAESTSAVAMFYAGNESGSYTLSSAASDTTPAAFSLGSRTGVAPGSEVSTSFTVGGINAATPIAIEGGTYQIGPGPFTGQPGVINDGQRVTVKLRAASQTATRRQLVLTVGSLSSTFMVTTSPYVRPVINLPNGVYASAREVTISVPGGLPEGASLYYTTDRSRPSLSTSTAYVGAFTVDRTTRVRAAVISADGLTVGPIADGYYQFNTVQPLSSRANCPIGINLDLWRIDLPIGRYARLESVSPPFVKGFSSVPYFVQNPDDSVDFFASVTGLPSAGSEFARSELREMTLAGSEAAWRFGDGTRSLSAMLTVGQMPSTGRVTVGQIHTNDGQVLARIEWQGQQGMPGNLVVFSRVHPDDPTAPSTVIARDLPWGQPVCYQLTALNSGDLQVSAAGTEVLVPLSSDWRTRTQYFKAGAYVHDNEGEESEGSRIRFLGIDIAVVPPLRMQ